MLRLSWHSVGVPPSQFGSTAVHICCNSIYLLARPPSIAGKRVEANIPKKPPRFLERPWDIFVRLTPAPTELPAPTERPAPTDRPAPRFRRLLRTTTFRRLGICLLQQNVQQVQTRCFNMQYKTAKYTRFTNKHTG